MVRRVRLQKMLTMAVLPCKPSLVAFLACYRRVLSREGPGCYEKPSPRPAGGREAPRGTTLGRGCGPRRMRYPDGRVREDCNVTGSAQPAVARLLEASVCRRR
jgi:hypothetical protein